MGYGLSVGQTCPLRDMVDLAVRGGIKPYEAELEDPLEIRQLLRAEQQGIASRKPRMTTAVLTSGVSENT